MRLSFGSLAQRILYGYVATFPRFVPVQSESATPGAQQQMHSFMKNVAGKLFENPGLLSLPSFPDDGYEWWEMQNSKPELNDAMRKISKKVDEFYQLLLQFGEIGVVEGSKLHVSKSDIKAPSKILSAFDDLGLVYENNKQELVLWSEEYPELASGWKLLSATSAKNSTHPTLLFSRCMYDIAYPHSREIFEVLAENKEAFRLLREFFEANGYTRVDFRDDGITLDWAKCYGKKDEPLKASWGERVHGGLSIYYDYKRKDPVLFGMRVPLYKELLSHFDEMDEDLKAFVIARTKKCDGCKYCTQTDKTGTRKRQVASVSSAEGEFDLCVLYPGFRYVWTGIDEKEAAKIIRLLTFIDKVFGKSQPDSVDLVS